MVEQPCQHESGQQILNEPYRFAGVHLAGLGNTAQVLTEPCLERSLCTANILRTFAPQAFTTVVLTGHRVDNPRGGAGDEGGDWEAITSVVTSVRGGLVVFTE